MRAKKRGRFAMEEAATDANEEVCFFPNQAADYCR